MLSCLLKLVVVGECGECMDLIMNVMLFKWMLGWFKCLSVMRFVTTCSMWRLYGFWLCLAKLAIGVSSNCLFYKCGW